MSAAFTDVDKVRPQGFRSELVSRPVTFLLVGADTAGARSCGRTRIGAWGSPLSSRGATLCVRDLALGEPPLDTSQRSSVQSLEPTGEVGRNNLVDHRMRRRPGVDLRDHAAPSRSPLTHCCYHRCRYPWLAPFSFAHVVVVRRPGASSW